MMSYGLMQARSWGVHDVQPSQSSKSYGPKKKLSLISAPHLNKKICYFFFFLCYTFQFF